MPKRKSEDGKLIWICGKCAEEFTGPAGLGKHYKEFPRHRPRKLRKKNKQSDTIGDGKAGPGRTAGRKNDTTIRRELQDTLMRVMELYAADGKEGGDVSQGLYKWISLNPDNMKFFLKEFFAQLVEKLVPKVISDEEKAAMGQSGAQNITFNLPPGTPIPNIAPEEPKMLDADTIEVEVIIPEPLEEEWQDDFEEEK